MKKILLTLFLLTATIAFSQNDTLQNTTEKDKSKNVKFMAALRGLYIAANGTGDNFLAKGYNGRFGLGLKVDFFEAYNFLLGTGGELLSYRNDNSANGGDGGLAISNFYAEIMYRVKITERFTMYPKISGGMSLFQYRTHGDSGSQNGHRFGFGAYLDYRLTNRLEVFAGTDYSLTYPGVKTHPDYEDFFGKVKQLNFSAGLKVNIRD